MFYIQKLEIKQFRCYKRADFSFSPFKNIIYGDNATGKTSLVEAIYYLGIGKTFKNTKDVDLITKGTEFMSLKGQIIDDSLNEANNIVLSFDGKTKMITKNNKNYPSLSEYLGYFNIVVFSPDDLDLIKGSPNERRRFLDINIGQIDKTYLNALMKLKKIVKERNEYLKTHENSINTELLDVYDEAIIEKSLIIIKIRQEFITKLNQLVNKINQDLSSNNEMLEMVYQANCSLDNIHLKARERRQNDLNLKQTTWGPTRDDLSFLINKENANIFASQGQIKTATLSLKLALAELFLQKNSNMIVILDDVFSELDIKRQKKLLSFLDLNIQTFITTTTIDHIDKELLKNSKLIQIRGENNE